MNVAEQARQNIRELNERLLASKLPLVSQFIQTAILNEEIIVEVALAYERVLRLAKDEAEHSVRLLLRGRTDVPSISSTAGRAENLSGQLVSLLRIRETYARGQLIGES